ncbi:hypothetical protein BRM3_12270 [Brachybacterium huguangmaarense]|uniref:Glycosyl hydrolase family 31 C-terminal domain-containing protein n=1 Tax=Brachybacterium huguangmaarense TaxID=1652028 RepID=A0ABY6FZJ1_9MICO|nr:TIM-barrel domain-containing protein [Brachybacterium huguangmaarense]UYG16372.1 hypothetical protein BRM3_12270 [Brachybacterium huguangmaarense]
MVGGGDIAAIGPDSPIDAEQFVRYAQCAALFPMMQFSLNPARVLGAEALAAVQAAVALRQSLVPEIGALVEAAARSGEPVLRPLASHHAGTEDVTDQFLLGEDVLVAPVLTPGATTRRVFLPRGRWTPIGTALGGTAEVIVGDDPAVLDLPVQLGTLRMWRRAA